MSFEPHGWRAALKVKLAAASQNDETAISEAFAQQAYAAVGNRCRAIMRDPYLLGFEIVERNEQNNRLVGVFAFRVVDEIVLAPVFFLNGSVKGQTMLYRKGVNRFIPNTQGWVNYLVSRGQDAMGGQLPDQVSNTARMNLDMSRLMGPVKVATAEGETTIGALWGELQGQRPELQPERLFAQMVYDQPQLKEAAARMIEKNFDFAYLVAEGKCLDVPVFEKKASAAPKLELITNLVEDITESELEALGKFGFAIRDERPDLNLEVITAGKEKNRGLRTDDKPGIRWIMSDAGDPVKVLWGPQGKKGRGCDSRLVVLEGPHKGETCDRYNMRKLADLPVFCDASGDLVTSIEELTNIGADLGEEVPEAGKTYAVWFPSQACFHESLIHVDAVKEEGDIIRVNFGGAGGSCYLCRRVVVRKDLDSTEECELHPTAYPVEDCAPSPGSAHHITFGSDCRWVEVKSKVRREKTYVDVDPQEPTFGILEADTALRRMLQTKIASVKVANFKGEWLIEAEGGKRFTTPSVGKTAMKLAQLGLSGKQAVEVVEAVKTGGEQEIFIMPPLEKLAHVWFGREPDPYSDFPITGVDSDLGIPVEFPDSQRQAYGTYREQQVGPAPRYGDARDPGPGYKALKHIPDEVIMNLENPGAELAELGRSLGMDTLIDHGAVGSLVQTFDAKPLVTDYITKMEASIDYLGRMLFLMLWKPYDFKELFGSDDLSQLENKLTGAFERYGDLVLELKQSVPENE